MVHHERMSRSTNSSAIDNPPDSLMEPSRRLSPSAETLSRSVCADIRGAYFSGTACADGLPRERSSVKRKIRTALNDIQRVCKNTTNGFLSFLILRPVRSESSAAVLLLGRIG